MAKTFHQLVGVTYTYTENPTEVPQPVIKAAKTTGGWPDSPSDFVCACWSDQLSLRYKAWVVVSKDLVVAMKAGDRTSMAPLANVTAIERSICKDISLSMPGNKADLFHAMNMPYKDLLDLMYVKINQTWQKAKSAAPKGGIDVADQIIKLKSLLDLGAITSTEFEKKKAELLDRM